MNLYTLSIIDPDGDQIYKNILYSIEDLINSTQYAIEKIEDLEETQEGHYVGLMAPNYVYRQTGIVALISEWGDTKQCLEGLDKNDEFNVKFEVENIHYFMFGYPVGDPLDYTVHIVKNNASEGNTWNGNLNERVGSMEEVELRKNIVERGDDKNGMVIEVEIKLKEDVEEIREDNEELFDYIIDILDEINGDLEANYEVEEDTTEEEEKRLAEEALRNKLIKDTKIKAKKGYREDGMVDIGNHADFAKFINKKLEEEIHLIYIECDLKFQEKFDNDVLAILIDRTPINV